MITPINQLSIKSWLESYGLPVAREAFPVRDANGVPNRVNVPFIVYRDETETDGGDLNNLVRYHTVTIELYTEDGDDTDFERWLYASNLKYSSSQSYVSKEQLFQSVFYLLDTLIEKKENLTDE